MANKLNSRLLIQNVKNTVLFEIAYCFTLSLSKINSFNAASFFCLIPNKQL